MTPRKVEVEFQSAAELLDPPLSIHEHEVILTITVPPYIK